MKKNAKSTESLQSSEAISKPATPEQIEEFKKVQAREAWIKMNQTYLDQIERKRLFYVRWILILQLIILIVSLSNFLLCLK